MIIEKLQKLFHPEEQKPVVRIKAIGVEHPPTEDEEITCPSCQVALEYEEFNYHGENPWYIVEVEKYAVKRCPKCNWELDNGEYEQLTQKIRLFGRDKH